MGAFFRCGLFFYGGKLEDADDDFISAGVFYHDHVTLIVDEPPVIFVGDRGVIDVNPVHEEGPAGAPQDGDSLVVDVVSQHFGAYDIADDDLPDNSGIRDGRLQQSCEMEAENAIPTEQDLGDGSVRVVTPGGVDRVVHHHLFPSLEDIVNFVHELMGIAFTDKISKVAAGRAVAVQFKVGHFVPPRFKAARLKFFKF